MNKSTIIRQLRKWGRAQEQTRIEEQKLIEFIDKYQGEKEQDECTHGSYGNGYGGWRDTCSNCYKVLTSEDKKKACCY